MDGSRPAKTPWDDLLTEQVRGQAGFFRGVARRIVRDHSLAEDACQQAFMKTWHCRETIRDRGSLRAFLTRVVVRESLQLLRKRKRHGEVLHDQARQSGGDEKMSMPQRLALRESLLLALDRLDADTRTVIVLRLVRGLPGRQVGQMLDCSEAQVSRRTHRGMEALREHLQDWHPLASRDGRKGGKP
ncbi:MAG: RNA polymerase sigma factor [Phycisphaeraceae bacterium]